MRDEDDVAKWLAYLAGVLAGRWMVQQMTTRPPEPEPGVPDEEPIPPDYRWHADDGDVMDEPPSIPLPALRAEQRRQFQPDPNKPIHILNGCPRCHGPVLMRRIDKVIFCDEHGTFRQDFRGLVEALPTTPDSEAA